MLSVVLLHLTQSKIYVLLRETVYAYKADYGLFVIFSICIGLFFPFCTIFYICIILSILSFCSSASYFIIIHNPNLIQNITKYVLLNYQLIKQYIFYVKTKYVHKKNRFISLGGGQVLFRKIGDAMLRSVDCRERPNPKKNRLCTTGSGTCVSSSLCVIFLNQYTRNKVCFR